MDNQKSVWGILFLMVIIAAGFGLAGIFAPAKLVAAAKPAKLTPVYVHMNGFNAFVESVVAVRPGQPVVFVNEDTGVHTVQGYNPITGKALKYPMGMLLGTPGPGHKVHTYTVRYSKPGVYYYYCTMHAVLEKVYKNMVQPAHRVGVHGFAGAMAGIIIVTKNPAILKQNAPTCRDKILKSYFGG